MDNTIIDRMNATIDVLEAEQRYWFNEAKELEKKCDDLNRELELMTEINDELEAENRRLREKLEKLEEQ